MKKIESALFCILSLLLLSSWLPFYPKIEFPFCESILVSDHVNTALLYRINVIR